MGSLLGRSQAIATNMLDCKFNTTHYQRINAYIPAISNMFWIILRMYVFNNYTDKYIAHPMYSKASQEILPYILMTMNTAEWNVRLQVHIDNVLSQHSD